MDRMFRRLPAARAMLIAGAALWLAGSPRTVSSGALPTQGGDPFAYAVTYTSLLAIAGLGVIGLGILARGLRARLPLAVIGGVVTLTGASTAVLPSTIEMEQTGIGPTFIGIGLAGLGSIVLALALAGRIRVVLATGGVALVLMAVGLSGAGFAVGVPIVGELLALTFGGAHLAFAFVAGRDEAADSRAVSHGAVLAA